MCNNDLKLANRVISAKQQNNQKIGNTMNSQKLLLLQQRHAQLKANIKSFAESICEGIKKLGLNVVGSKVEISEKMISDVEEFLAKGGEITYC